MKKLTKRAVIISNGDFPTHNTPLEYLQTYNTIICCDGAINHAHKAGIMPNYIIGDLDSINKDLKEKFSDRIINIEDQGENDLRKAINWLEKQKFNEAIILGATGKREDHTIANIFTILQYQTNIDLKIITDHGYFSPMKEQESFTSYQGQQVSIFSLDPTIKVTTINLKYQMNKRNINTIYSGTLNESLSDTFSLNISHGKVLIYQAF